MIKIEVVLCGESFGPGDLASGIAERVDEASGEASLVDLGECGEGMIEAEVVDDALGEVGAGSGEEDEGVSLASVVFDEGASFAVEVLSDVEIVPGVDLESEVCFVFIEELFNGEGGDLVGVDEGELVAEEPRGESGELERAHLSLSPEVPGPEACGVDGEEGFVEVEEGDGAERRVHGCGLYALRR